jgi:flagellar assembly factor FliW
VIIETRAFGPIDVLDENIISFNSSLPGFPDSKRFVVISDGAEQQHATDSFCWLQSVDEPQIAFAMLNTLNVYKDYSPVIEREELGELRDAREEDLSVYNIVVIPDDVTKSTVNLKAPVLIDHNKKIGKQVIAANNNYMIRHSIGNSFTG